MHACMRIFLQVLLYCMVEPEDKIRQIQRLAMILMPTSLEHA